MVRVLEVALQAKDGETVLAKVTTAAQAVRVIAGLRHDCLSASWRDLQREVLAERLVVVRKVVAGRVLQQQQKKLVQTKLV